MLRTLINRLCLYSCFCVLTFAITGCEQPKPLGTLTGTVRSKGEICDNCLISIASKETLFRRGGSVNEEGRFTLTDIPFGEYKIRVVQMPTNATKKVNDDRIPKKYRRPETSGLTASIPSAEPVTFDIDME